MMPTATITNALLMLSLIVGNAIADQTKPRKEILMNERNRRIVGAVYDRPQCATTQTADIKGAALA